MAEEFLGDVVFGGEVVLPEFFAGGEIEAAKDAGDTEGDDDAFTDDRTAAGTGGEAVVVDILDGIVVGPEAFAGFAIQAFDGLFFVESVEDHAAIADDGGGSVAIAHADFPDEGGTGGGPLFEKR